ncbi:MAG TPA: hypothetical protein VGN86_03760 [Pyrinomonadaceae bacterium]|nr:hypothetical protein [Pyrinomonadaceae bacterium]
MVWRSQPETVNVARAEGGTAEGGTGVSPVKRERRFDWKEHRQDADATPALHERVVTLARGLMYVEDFAGKHD